MNVPESQAPQNLGPLSLCTAIFTKRPLIAYFEQSNRASDGELGEAGQRLTGVLVRDAQGRTREEYFEEDAVRTPLLVKIYDPVAGTALALDPKDRIGIRITLDLSAEPLGGDFLFPFARIDEVGEEEVLGYRCSRYECRGDHGAEARGRVWVAEDLGLVLREEIVYQNEIRRWSVCSVERVEPSAEQFVAPAGFLIESR